jgi:hypothetical protein
VLLTGAHFALLQGLGFRAHNGMLMDAPVEASSLLRAACSIIGHSPRSR